MAKASAPQKSKTIDTKATSRKLKPWLHVLVWIASIVLLSMLAAKPMRKSIQHERYPPEYPLTAYSKTKLMNQLHPQVIMVGHSYLKHSIIREQFCEQSGLCAAKEHLSGSMSAYWYLMLKNVALRTNPKPRFFMVFFAGDELSTPRAKVDRHYKQYIDMLADYREPILDQLAYFDPENPVSDFLKNHWGLYQHREEIRNEIEQGTKNLLGAISPWLSSDSLAEASQRSFNDSLFDARLYAQAQEQARLENTQYNFNKQNPNSFLPEIIRLARGAGISPVFVRVPREADLYPNKQAPALKQYLSDLQTFLNTEQVSYIDIAAIAPQNFKPDDWYDSNHMVNQGSGAERFTELVAGQMRRLAGADTCTQKQIHQFLAVPVPKYP